MSPVFLPVTAIAYRSAHEQACVGGAWDRECPYRHIDQYSVRIDRVMQVKLVGLAAEVGDATG